MPRKLPKLKTPTELREEAEKKLTFSDKWEEELKKQLFEEKEEIDTSKGEEYLLSNTVVHKKRPGEEWDVPLSEKIEYFDPELSYELTGYRPITMDQGLDFDPTPFREMALLYEREGCYTKYPAGRKLYNDLWDREFDRCENGLTIGKYRITGDHYFFLNYYRMDVINEGSIAGAGRSESFPSFLSKQYEWFHYVEMAEKLHKDACALKARGVGWSEMTASMAVRPYTTHRGYHVLLTCSTEFKLTPLKNKCWRNLDWLNTNTSGGMRHVRLAVNNVDTKRASVKSLDGTEYGWMSEINSVVADTADKIRGDRLDRLIYEEAGSNKNLTASWIKGDALVSLGGFHFGTRIALGCVCAGTKVWTRDGRHINIENLQKEDGIIGFHNGSFYQEDIEAFKTPEEKDCVRIVTNFGTLECSSDHPIFTRIQKSKRIKGEPNKRETWYEYQWVRADEVDMYAQRNTIGICDKIDVWGNETLFDPYLVGLLIGDGSYGYDKTPRLSNCDPEVLSYVEGKYDCTNDSEPRLTKEGKLYKELRIKGICPKLREIGVYGQTKSNKRLPCNYMSLTKNDSIQLLSGLFDTDGTVTHSHGGKRGWRIGLTQSSEEILKQVKELLEKLGIYGKIYKQEPRISENRKDKNPWYNFYIEDTVSLINFAEQIPLKIKCKQERLNTILELKDSIIYQHYLTYSGIRESHVIRVEHIGKRMVYNLTAGGVHTYLANNFITHNTGGDDMALEGLSTMFSNPNGYNILPFKNYDTDDGKPEITAFFLPAHKFALTTEYLDNRGVTDHVRFRKFYEEQRAKLSDKDYLDECAEHCFTPREALSKHGDNVFDANLLAERLVQIKTNKNITKPKRMQLLWDKTIGNGMSKVVAQESINSKLLVIEPPILDETGNPYKNLYVAGIDAIDMGKRDSATDNDVSDFCIVIKKRVFGMDDPKYVAIYKDRPNDIRKAYDLTLKLLTWYNCKAMLEYTKISIQTYFKEKGKDNLFMKRPEFAISSKKKSSKSLVGLPATEAVINHGLELVSNFVNDYWYTIDFEEIIDQLINYSYVDKRKFDIVAALQMVEIADEDMSGVTPTTVTSIKSKWQDFGWYTDEYGRKRRGVIPNTNNRWL